MSRALLLLCCIEAATGPSWSFGNGGFYWNAKPVRARGWSRSKTIIHHQTSGEAKVKHSNAVARSVLQHRLCVSANFFSHKSLPISTFLFSSLQAGAHGESDGSRGRVRLTWRAGTPSGQERGASSLRGSSRTLTQSSPPPPLPPFPPPLLTPSPGTVTAAPLPPPRPSPPNPPTAPALQFGTLRMGNNGSLTLRASSSTTWCIQVRAGAAADEAEAAEAGRGAGKQGRVKMDRWRPQS